MATRDVAIKLSLRDAELVKRGLEQLGADGQKALRKLESASKKPNRGLRALNSAVKSGKREMGSWASSVGAGTSVLSAFGVAGVGAAVAAGALFAALRKSREAVREAAEIGELASQAGVTAEQFQEAAIAADKFGVSISALTDAQKELSLRTDEFVTTGAGPAAEALERLGYTQDELAGKLRDSSALFDEVIDRIAVLDTRAAQIRVADEIFGGQGGEQLVQLLDAGAGAMARLRQEARDLGVILNEDEIRKARELSGELKLLERVIDTKLRSAFLDLAPVLVTVVDAFADIAKFAGDVVNRLKGVEDLAIRGLEQRVIQVKKLLDEENAREARVFSAGPRPQRVREFEDEYLKARDLLHFRRLLREEREKEEIEARSSEVPKQIQDVIDALRIEHQQLKRTATEQAVHNALRRAGIEATSEHAQTIRDLVTAIEREQNAMKGAAKELDAASGFRRAFEQIRDDAEDMASQVEQVVTRAFSSMEDALVQFVRTGKLDFTSLADAIIADMIRIQARQALVSVFDNLWGGGSRGTITQERSGQSGTASSGGPSGGFDIGAMLGKVFGSSSFGDLVPFANGGVINRPSLFPLANGGIGLAGEDGEEGIFPLRRIGGQLGVRGTAPQVTVEVPVKVTVVNETGSRINAEVESIQGADGIDLQVTVRDQVIDTIRSGDADEVLEERFDLVQPTWLRD